MERLILYLRFVISLQWCHLTSNSYAWLRFPLFWFSWFWFTSCLNLHDFTQFNFSIIRSYGSKDLSGKGRHFQSCNFWGSNCGHFRWKTEIKVIKMMMIATGTSTMYKATDPEKYNMRWEKACFLVQYPSMKYSFDF